MCGFFFQSYTSYHENANLEKGMQVMVVYVLKLFNLSLKYFVGFFCIFFIFFCVIFLFNVYFNIKTACAISAC